MFESPRYSLKTAFFRRSISGNPTSSRGLLLELDRRGLKGDTPAGKKRH